jgi:lysozyme-like protein
MAVLNQSQLRQILRQAGRPQDLIQIMSAIGMAESSGRTTALNNRPGREYSVGIWQINLLAYREYTAAEMQDPLQNARAAEDLSQ